MQLTIPEDNFSLVLEYVFEPIFYLKILYFDLMCEYPKIIGEHKVFVTFVGF